MRFAANTGFLWRQLPFEERLRRAAAAGFDAVEFHDEAQGADLARLADLLGELALPVAGLNTRMGATAGCAALPGQGDAARRDIEAAAEAARALRAEAIHVVAGRGEGSRAAYCASLTHALEIWEGTVLIEPISAAGVPGYWMDDLGLAREVLAELGHPRLKLMLDGFHMAAMGRDLWAEFAADPGVVGHVQIAAFPDRDEPDTGSPDYAAVLPRMVAAGYRGRFGAEYRARAGEEAGLGWMERLRAG